MGQSIYDTPPTEDELNEVSNLEAQDGQNKLFTDSEQKEISPEVQEDAYADVSNLLKGNQLLPESVTPITSEVPVIPAASKLVNAPVKSLIDKIPTPVLDTVVGNELGLDDLSQKEASKLYKTKTSDSRPRELVRTAKEAGLDSPHLTRDARSKRAVEAFEGSSKRIGDIWKEVDNLAIDKEAYKSQLGKKIRQNTEKFIADNFKGSKNVQYQEIIKALRKDTDEIIKTTNNLKDLDRYSVKLPYKESVTSIPTEIRNARKLAFRDLVRDELVTFAKQSGSINPDDVGKLYTKYGNLREIVERSTKEVSKKGKNVLQRAIRDEDLGRKAGGLAGDIARQTGKTASKFTKEALKRSIPLVGAGFGAGAVYDELTKRGYNGYEAGIISFAAGLGFFGTDFINLAGPKGFLAQFAADEAIHQVATRGYDNIRRAVIGDPKGRKAVEEFEKGADESSRNPQSLDERGQNVLKRAVQKYDKS